MNKIIERVLQELSKDEPRLDYIRGALETLLEIQDGVVAQIGRALPEPMNHDVIGRQKKVSGSTPDDSTTKDEGQVLDAMTRARIEKVKALAEKSTELA